MGFLSKLKFLLLDLLFPIYCIGCNKEKTHCCRECFQKIRLIPAKLSPPQFSAPSLDFIFAAAQFREKSPLAELIHRFKYDSAEDICDILASFFPTEAPTEFADGILIPVPLHPRRTRHRGFNQSAILTHAIGKKWRLDSANVLERTRYTTPQVELTREKRLTNLTNAFVITKGTLINSNRIYVLVDDVCTTGTTLNECAKVLKQSGAKKVIGLVLGKA